MHSQKSFRSAALVATLLSCAELRAGTILAGTQYQQSLFGQFDLGTGLGIVPTTGRPFGPGNTSVEILRLADTTTSPNTPTAVPVRMVAISIQSTAPVEVNGSPYDVFIHLTPNTVSLGTEVIYQSGAGSDPFQGWFFLDTQPYVTVDFTPVGTGQAFSQNLHFTATSDLGRWRHAPHAGELIVSSLADTSLDNCHDPANGCPQDFFIDGTLTFSGARAGGQTNACSVFGVTNCDAAATPEPASFQLHIGAGLLMLSQLRKRSPGVVRHSKWIHRA